MLDFSIVTTQHIISYLCRRIFILRRLQDHSEILHFYKAIMPASGFELSAEF